MVSLSKVEPVSTSRGRGSYRPKDSRSHQSNQKQSTETRKYTKQANVKQEVNKQPSYKNTA